jgi:N-methylhydantoinase B/oxoprolinase/acetone carboxylase alpha subunit
MLRDGSGGAGEFVGGAGVIRRYRFTRPLTLSVLTERRYGARFSTEIYTRWCHWIPRMFA